MDNRETQCSGPAVVLAFLGGAMAGVVAGLLLAPKPGEETRRALKGYGRKAEEEVLEQVTPLREQLLLNIVNGQHGKTLPDDGHVSYNMCPFFLLWTLLRP